MTAARDFPANTCGASRHTQFLAELLMSGRPLLDLQHDRQHCGESIAATVEALWKLRSATLRMPAALRLSEVLGRWLRNEKDLAC